MTLLSSKGQKVAITFSEMVARFTSTTEQRSGKASSDSHPAVVLSNVFYKTNHQFHDPFNKTFNKTFNSSLSIR